MSSTFKVSFLFSLILLPVVLYLATGWLLSEPVFFSDDFHLLKTVLWIGEEPTITGKMGLFLQQHNEHRIVVPRLMTYLNYLIFGHISWPVLILLGNILWASILWFFWKGFRSTSSAIWLFIPAPLILLNPQYYDNLTWSISILQQSVIVFWFVALSYLCARGRYGLGLLVCLIATFTHGNGIFSFLIAIFYLVYDRQWKWLGIVALAWVATGVIYFFDFNKGQNADFMKSLSDPVRLIASFFAFFGSLSKVRFLNSQAAVVIGMVLFLGLGLFTIVRFFHFRNKHLPVPWSVKMVAGILAFLTITGGLVSVSRSWGGIETIIAPRYQHYSSFIACLVYLSVVSVLSGRLQKIVGIAAIAGSILFNLLCYYTYTEELFYRRDGLLADDTNWVHHHNFLYYGKSFNDNIRSDYERAVQKGICIAKDHFTHIEADTLRSGSVSLQYAQVVKEEKDASRTYLRNYVTMSNSDITDRHVFIFLKSETGENGYWLASKKSHNGILDLLRTRTWLKPGFTLEFLTENMLPGHYNIAILRNNSLVWTSETITIAEPPVIQ